MERTNHARSILTVCMCVDLRGCSHLPVLIANGVPAIGKIGVFDFLLGTTWRPEMIFTVFSQ